MHHRDIGPLGIEPRSSAPKGEPCILSDRPQRGPGRIAPHPSALVHEGHATPDTTRKPRPLDWRERPCRLINEPEEHLARKYNFLLVVQSHDARVWSGYVEGRCFTTGRRQRVNAFRDAASLEEAQALCEALADAAAKEDA